MRVVVVTVYAHRPEHPKFIDYKPLLRCQRDSAARFGHDHLVIADTDLGKEFRQVTTDLPESLMKAMIVGVLVGLKESDGRHMVFADADCLVAKDLEPAFEDGWDLGLTRRVSELSPINNGAMYVNASGVGPATGFFERALSLCGDHWGADQEAVSAAAAPVPDTECVQDRGDIRIAFLSMRSHAVVPKTPNKRHDIEPYMVHFKGKTKAWMEGYAKKFVL